MQNCLTAEISVSAVRTNLQLLRSRLEARTRMCVAVKADCYGHGLDILLETIVAEAHCLAVATGAEALELRGLGYAGLVIMFFTPGVCGADGSGGCAYEGLDELIAADITLTVCSLTEAQAVAAASRSLGKAAEVHVMADTGMGRSGAPAGDTPEIVRWIRADGAAKLTGLYTHFACADEKDRSSVEQQWECFQNVIRECGGRDELLLHAANSPATVDFSHMHLDMVRPGLMVYGYLPSDCLDNAPPVQPSMRVSSTVMRIKDVPAGSRCGYGLTYTFDRPSRIALVPVGYADGYFRCFSNRATMRVAGRDVPIRGRVSMDQTIIDLTDVPDVNVGDEVEIVSPDRTAPHSVEALARLGGTIPHEIVCAIGAGKRITRVLI